jgi:hypothetical protein
MEVPYRGTEYMPEEKMKRITIASRKFNPESS